MNYKYITLLSIVGLFACHNTGRSVSIDGPPFDAGQSVDAGITSVCGDPSRSGITECRVDCAAGQYCDDSGSVRECVAGCTSDANCGSSDYCQRDAGEAVGVCASCGGATFGSPRASCLSPGRQGITDCRVDCPAGQYCDDSGSVRECVPGCTSDANCFANDSCVREPGEAIGACASCYPVDTPPPSPEDCEEACRDAGRLCPLIEPGDIAACVLSCRDLTEAEQATLVECVEAAQGGRPCAVESCLPAAETSCEQACEFAGARCETGEVTPADVAACKGACPMATPDLQQAFVDCIDAADARPEPCAELACFG